VAKHFENFTMQVSKLHRLDHDDKAAAYAKYLHEVSRKAYKRPMSRLLGVKEKLMPVLIPLLMAGPVSSVATSIVFMSKPSSKSFSRRAGSSSSSARAA
jgi:hypothetical protein